MRVKSVLGSTLYLVVIVFTMLHVVDIPVTIQGILSGPHSGAKLIILGAYFLVLLSIGFLLDALLGLPDAAKDASKIFMILGAPSFVLGLSMYLFEWFMITMRR